MILNGFDPVSLIHNRMLNVEEKNGDTARLWKSVRTADCNTIYNIYLSYCTQSAWRTFFDRQAVSKWYKINLLFAGRID